MKDYIIPYVVGKNGQWWAGVDIYNHSSSENAIVIKIYRHANGVQSRTINAKIKAYQHHLLLPDDIVKDLMFEDGRATIIITGPDNLMITPFQGTTDLKTNQGTGFGILPVFEDTNLKN